MNRLDVKAFFVGGVQPFPHRWRAELNLVRKQQKQSIRARAQRCSIVAMQVAQPGKNKQRCEGGNARVLDAFFHGCATSAAQA